MQLPHVLVLSLAALVMGVVAQYGADLYARDVDDMGFAGHNLHARDAAAEAAAVYDAYLGYLERRVSPSSDLSPSLRGPSVRPLSISHRPPAHTAYPPSHPIRAARPLTAAPRDRPRPVPLATRRRRASAKGRRGPTEGRRRVGRCCMGEARDRRWGVEREAAGLYQLAF